MTDATTKTIETLIYAGRRFNERTGKMKHCWILKSEDDAADEANSWNPDDWASTADANGRHFAKKFIGIAKPGSMFDVEVTRHDDDNVISVAFGQAKTVGNYDDAVRIQHWITADLSAATTQRTVKLMKDATLDMDAILAPIQKRMFAARTKTERAAILATVIAHLS